jgi:WhiB family transcriptional regulator, redox-sensing transcriptional regulator
VFPTSWWFSSDPQETASAKQICLGCPVREACLEYAISRPALQGLWAATRAGDRAAIRTMRRHHPN